MVRKSTPEKIKAEVLDEYNHRCAVCGGDRPHLHHINENPADNRVENLLPLCPNCHLRDQHHPTRKVDIPKLILFRSHKDPAILKPQFHPIYTRSLFLSQIELSSEPVDELEEFSNQLIDFIANLEMGDFYSKQIAKLIAPLKVVFIIPLEGDDSGYQKQRKARNKAYREKLKINEEHVYNLLVELLRYQPWTEA